MKRTILILLTGFLLLSLTACGEKDVDTEPETDDYENLEVLETWEEEAGEDSTTPDISAEDAEAQRRALDHYLTSVEETVQTDPDKAAKMLESLPEGSLNPDQIQWVAGIKTEISLRKAELEGNSDTQNSDTWTSGSREETPVESPSTEPKHPVLSPEKAAEYLKKAYPQVEGDVGDALLPQYNEKGELYYSITMQLPDGEIKPVHIFADGTVKVAE